MPLWLYKHVKIELINRFWVYKIFDKIIKKRKHEMFKISIIVYIILLKSFCDNA